MLRLSGGTNLIWWKKNTPTCKSNGWNPSSMAPSVVPGVQDRNFEAFVQSGLLENSRENQRIIKNLFNSTLKDLPNEQKMSCCTLTNSPCFILARIPGNPWIHYSVHSYAVRSFPAMRSMTLRESWPHAVRGVVAGVREADGEIPLAASESVGVPKSVYKNCKNSKVVPYYSDNDLLQNKFVAYYSVADWPVYVLGDA